MKLTDTGIHEYDYPFGALTRISDSATSIRYCRPRSKCVEFIECLMRPVRLSVYGGHAASGLLR